MAVTDEAITKIKEMLISGQLKAGDRLPPENELSDQLGLSRSSLREAVKALELIRVLDVRRGDGTYVTSLEPGLLTETMGFMVEIHQESSAAELLEVRRILEPGAAAHAAGRIDSRSVAALHKCLESVPPEASAADLASHDFTFHSLIARASGNPYLAGLLDSLTGSALRLRTWQRITEAGAAEAVLGEHAAILDALTVGDAELARSLMTVHVSSAERWLRRPPAEPPRPVTSSRPATPSSSVAPALPRRAMAPTPAPEPAAPPMAEAPPAAKAPKETLKKAPGRAPKKTATLQVPAAPQLPATRQARTPAPQIARIAPDPAVYELFAMPSTPGQKAARKPRRPA
ncbi:FadR/GntR family transcriptional regulator [Arthrobacter sp. ZGTC212]|uniref:FadR/GntR family transcriptional regulator n=1 Tax=Arthrobacter sp. ZGTC212 TaxID=2058899 RepID=UPI001C67C980|nr:FadR/GntR family transcriptional regulator [Arthrobacter sp. ZGTC212]